MKSTAAGTLNGYDCAVAEVITLLAIVDITAPEMLGEVPNTFAPEPVLVVTPVPPLATGNVPVTPVVKGSPVQLVSVPLEGVPKAPPDAIRVPVVAGRVITVVPAIAGAAIVTEPDVSPAMTILDIYYP